MSSNFTKTAIEEAILVRDCVEMLSAPIIIDIIPREEVDRLMAAILAPPPNTTKNSLSLLVRDSQSFPLLQSPEGQTLVDLTKAIWQHLTVALRSLESLKESTPIDQRSLESEEEDSSEISYRPVPPNRTFTVRVRCQFKGRGKPLPYPLDDVEIDELPPFK